MVNISSSKLSGDFLQFPYSFCPSVTLGESLFCFDVVPETTDPHIPVSLSSVKCVDLIKSDQNSDIRIRLYSTDSSLASSSSSSHDGYSLRRYGNGDGMRDNITQRASFACILTNVNGHFFIPIANTIANTANTTTGNLLTDLVEFIRNIAGNVCVRVTFYNDSHNVDGLLQKTQKKLQNIRKLRTRTVLEGEGESRKSRIESYYSNEKGGEFDIMGNDLVAQMRQYPTKRLCSIFVFSDSFTNFGVINGVSFPSVSPTFDSLKFVSVTPLKRKVGWFKKVDIPIGETLSHPVFFDVKKTISKCSGGNYFSDGWLSRRKNSPIICVDSNSVFFPFAHPLISKTTSNKEMAEKTNEDSLLDDDDENNNNNNNNSFKPAKDNTNHDVVDSDFFSDDDDVKSSTTTTTPTTDSHHP